MTAYRNNTAIFSTTGYLHYYLSKHNTQNFITPAFTLSYSENWILTAKSTVAVSGTTYTSGQTIKTWAWGTSVNFTLTCDVLY